MTRFLPPARGPVRALASAGVAVGIALAAASAASAGTVNIQDTSGVLDTASVQTGAATLPASVYIWTTGQNGMSRTAFDADVRGKVSPQFPIAVGVDTGRRHSSVQIGTIAGLTQTAADSAEATATTAFDTTMRSTRSYTDAVTALLNSLKALLTAALPTTATTTTPPTTTTTTTTTPTTTTPSAGATTHAAAAGATANPADSSATTPDSAAAPPHANGPGTTVIVVGIVVVVLMLTVLTDVFRRGGKPVPASGNGDRPTTGEPATRQSLVSRVRSSLR